MSTIRVAHRARYTSIDRGLINDSRLSFRARGVLAWLLDKPDDWHCDSTAISRAGMEGRDAVRAALRELERCGYLVRKRLRAEGGRMVTESVIYERPVDNSSTEDGFPGVGSPGVGFPGAHRRLRPNTEKPPISPTTERTYWIPPVLPVDEPENIDRVRELLSQRDEGMTPE